MSVSKRAAKRQAIKEARRTKRKLPPTKRGSVANPRGHDKAGSKKRSMVYYSDASAELLRGKPNPWPGLEFRPK